LIVTRQSYRTYDPSPLVSAVREQLGSACAELNKGLLGEPARFQLIARPAEELRRMKLGAGAITNPAGLLAGAVKNSPMAWVSYGYLMEQLLLKATDLGLGTCWAAMFAPNAITGIGLTGDEICPAVVTVGYLPHAPTLKERLIRSVIRADQRKTWEELFFRDNRDDPLSRGQSGNYAVALDMVRYAPSAGNKQPWRVIKARSIPVFNFYLKPASPTYEKRHLHDVDLGIALCHFELGAREMALKGSWQLLDTAGLPPFPGARYIMSWFGEEAQPGYVADVETEVEV
jgi:nitroreductase